MKKMAVLPLVMAQIFRWLPKNFSEFVFQCIVTPLCARACRQLGVLSYARTQGVWEQADFWSSSCWTLGRTPDWLGCPSRIYENRWANFARCLRGRIISTFIQPTYQGRSSWGEGAWNAGVAERRDHSLGRLRCRYWKVIKQVRVPRLADDTSIVLKAPAFKLKWGQRCWIVWGCTKMKGHRWFVAGLKVIC